MRGPSCIVENFLCNNKLPRHELKEVNLILDTSHNVLNNNHQGKFIFGIQDVIEEFRQIKTEIIVIKISKLMVKGIEYDEGKLCKIKDGSADSNDSQLNFVNKDTLVQTTALLSHFTKI